MATLAPLELTFDGQAGAVPELVVLHHTPAWWIAEFRGSVASRVKAIAGSSTVTTGFNGHVPGTVVRSAIAALNPGAEVMLAQAEHNPAPATPKDEMLALAADVVRNENHSQAADLDRARRIRRGFGTLAACSFLRDRGWSFEAAYGALVSSKPS